MSVELIVPFFIQDICQMVKRPEWRKIDTPVPSEPISRKESGDE